MRRIQPFDEQRDSLEEMTAMLHAAYRELLDRGLNYTAATQGVETTESRIRRAAICWVAREANELIGTIAYYDGNRDQTNPSWYGREDVGHFGQFAVDPARQRRGLGSELIALAESRAAADGKRELACDTAAPADRLIEFYESRGYRIVGRHHWPGKTYQSVVLSKHLAPG